MAPPVPVSVEGETRPPPRCAGWVLDEFAKTSTKEGPNPASVFNLRGGFGPLKCLYQKGYQAHWHDSPAAASPLATSPPPPSSAAQRAAGLVSLPLDDLPPRCCFVAVLCQKAGPNPRQLQPVTLSLSKLLCPLDGPALDDLRGRASTPSPCTRASPSTATMNTTSHVVSCWRTLQPYTRGA